MTDTLMAGHDPVVAPEENSMDRSCRQYRGRNGECDGARGDSGVWRGSRGRDGVRRDVRNGTRGFTLVELIVAISISLIVIGVATAILLSGTNMAQHTAQRALEQQIIDGAFNFAQDRLLFAGSVEQKTPAELATTSLDPDTSMLYVSSGAGTTAESRGMLFFRQATSTSSPSTLNVMGEEFYWGYTISLEAELTGVADKNPVVLIRMKLHDKTDPTTVVATRERTITLINGTPVGENEDYATAFASPDFLYLGTTAPTP
jgi:prepilin-type N-terminal cleavage/methylation domain-containing protein